MYDPLLSPKFKVDLMHLFIINSNAQTDRKMANPAVPMPQSLAEVEQLVIQLYEPGSPKIIAAIQEHLQTLQRSTNGWQMADALLGSQDPKVRFFGALTFTVKLNLDWQVEPLQAYRLESLIDMC
ncbi:hypothetical protein B0A49_00794 [Cryomyces minteri]|uniref:Importin N-terminal domain-containing protein n=1 Tax=Cryomyces minteri TaxID=331657 RepID=A0A4U0XJX9_9PEZI|nr:hypothetical protein B0A49_00794 [Cryomyces minteri]